MVVVAVMDCFVADAPRNDGRGDAPRDDEVGGAPRNDDGGGASRDGEGVAKGVSRVL